MSNLSQEEREDMIDLYLSGKMPKDERIKFEKAMESDPDLKKDVHIYASIIHGIREVGLEKENKRLQRIAEEAKILEKEYVVMSIPDYNGGYEHKIMTKDDADKRRNESFNYVEWEGTKADIIMDAGRTTFSNHYEPIHENPIDTTVSLQDLAKGWGILDKEDIKMMEQIRAELENEKQNSQIVGLEKYSEKDIEKLVRDHFKNVLEGSEIDAEIVAVKVIGSRVNGNSDKDSDLDVLLEYKGKAKEDGLFNVLNHSEEGHLYIEGIPVDINPITEGKSGTIQQFLERNKDYVKSVDIDNHNNSVMEENEKLQATIKDVTSRDEQFRYQLLDRMKQDCNYFLDFGNRNENSLWAGNAKDHVAVMQALWESLPQKPEWLTKEELADYAGKMLESEKKVQEKVADAKAHPEPLSEEQSKVAETKDFKSVIDSASKELQSLLDSGRIDFMQQINKPLRIVNDDSLPDVEYAYIRELSVNNSKISVKGDIEVYGSPNHINSLNDLSMQGVVNLLQEVRDIVQWQPEINLSKEQALMVADHYGYRAEVEQDMKDGMRPEWALRKHDIMPSKEAFEEMKDLNDPEKLPIVDAVPMLLDKVIPNKGDELMLSAIGGQIDIQYIRFGYQEIENVKSIKNTGDGYVATNGEISVDVSRLATGPDKEYLFSVINNSVKQNREKSMSKETQPDGGTVNAVQEGQNAQPEKKAVTNLGKEAKAIITGDALADKTRKTLESSEQSVVLIRTRDRDTKANVYQAFGEDAGKINAASKKAEMSTPTIGENKYQVVTFSDKEAKSIAKDLADANLQVHLITKQGVAIKNDNAFTQDATQQAQQKGNKEEKGEQKTVKEAPAKEATVKETPANGKEEEYQRRAGKAAELQQPDSFVALNIKSSKDSYFQAFGKDADYAAKILDKQVKTTEGNINYLSFKEDDLNKVSAAAAKDGKTAVIKEYAAPILEKAQEKSQEKAQVNTVDLKPDSKVEFDISKNLHAKGIYDIKLIVDDNKVAAHHLSKEDRDAFFKKDISGKDLVEKYFSKELNGASPEVTRSGIKQEKEPLMTTVNGEKVTDARVFTSEKGNNFFVAAIEGKQLKPQFIPDEMAKGFKEGNVKIQDMMEKAYPSKVMPKVPEEQFKSNKLSDGREFSFFRIEKESNQEKKDFGKYRLEAVVDGQKLKSAALPVKDLNEYFDRVTTKSALVEKHLGESLNMKAAYDKYKLPEGAKMGENTTFRVEKDNAQRRFFISGEVNGNSLDRKQLSYNDGASFLKKAASEEQLGAKYFSKEVSNIIKSTNTMAIKQEHSANLKR